MSTSNSPLTHQSEYKARQKARRLTFIQIFEDASVALEEERAAKAKAKGYAHSPLKTALGWTARKIGLDGSITQLPPYMNKIFSACRELIDNPYRFRTLCLWGGAGIYRRDTRKNLAKVMVVLLARCDLTDGRIGVPSKNGMDTISHHELMNDYVLRWGEMIEESKWHRYVKFLSNAGFITTLPINISINDETGQGSEIRAIAAYKQFSTAFFTELRVPHFKNVATEIYQNRLNAENKGYRFDWIPFRMLANRLVTCLNATLCNQHTTHFRSSPVHSPH
ncbi:hypothetical protein HC723_10925 [Vibrio sp. S11_S32]|uniref:hypothetical protein n=1 Tax=Vibrio sp. S11_S32 TaxID=2720225 RepID=UPI0016817BCA|nr:hypothetical protein [Vibrio sp. S11_S32]MBD1576941.1 hypothetical protein [Vibrio sp. S11_S32]